jgi:nucleoside-diphosphate-sugar epimerase
MRVLVIGGTGLISTAIVEQLLARGDRVTLFNRGVTARRFEGDVDVIVGDRWKYADFEREMRQRTFDAVIDMVAFAPENAGSLLRAFSGRAGHLVVCSTVCVYGGPLTRSPATDDEPHRPATKYGHNKSLIESTLLAANGQSGLMTTILRPSFTTGEGHTALGALYFDDSMADRARRGLPLVVHDDGATPWAIAHVSDVARGFVNALGNERAYGQAYHLTSDEHTTWGGVFAALQEAAGGKSPVVPIPTDLALRRRPAPHGRRQVHLSIRLDLRQRQGGARPRLQDHRAAGRDLPPPDRLVGARRDLPARGGRALAGRPDRRVHEGQEARPGAGARSQSVGQRARVLSPRAAE